MSREDEIVKIDEQLEKLGEAPEVEEIEDDVSDDDAGDDEKQPVVDEKPKEEDKPVEVKPEVKLEVKDLPEGAGWFKAREAQRKLEEVQRENEELKKPKIAKEENYEGYIENELTVTKQKLSELEVRLQKQDEEKQADAQLEGAFRELKGYESEAANAFDDFPDAANYAKSIMAASIKALNPRISKEDLAQKTVMAYATFAGQSLSEKKHPGQAIYEYAKEMGYKKTEERPQITEKEDNKPSLTKIAENKKKSSGMSNNGGNGKAFINTEAMMSMTNAEKMKLTPSDWERMEAEG